MSLPLNHITLNGWIYEEVQVDSSGNAFFLLLQHPYHVSFHAVEAADGLFDGILVEVHLYSKDLESNCRSHLKRGDRVTVEGRLQRLSSAHFEYDAAVIAFTVERSETLESLRYFNHPWRELRLIPTPDAKSASIEGGSA